MQKVVTYILSSNHKKPVMLKDSYGKILTVNPGSEANATKGHYFTKSKHDGQGWRKIK